MRLNQSIQKSIQVLSSFPELGLKTDVANVRYFINDYLEIFYEISNKTFYILSIWDTRRNSREKFKIDNIER